MGSLQIMNDFVILPCRNGAESAKILNSHIEKICANSMHKLVDKKDFNFHDERLFNYLRFLKESTNKLFPVNVTEFEDGEILPTIKGSVRGKNVYIVQNTFNPSNPKQTSDNIIELENTIDAVKRSSPASVIVVLPYMSYSKQERRQGRQSITAKVFLDKLVQLGVDKMLTMDLHAPAIEGFTSGKDMTIDPLFISPVFKSYLDSIGFKGILAAPDAGAAKTVKHYSKAMNLPLGLGYKIRAPDSTHTAETQDMLGKYRRLDVALMDDQIASGGTTYKASVKLKEKGAKTVRAFATAGLFLKDAEELFLRAKAEGIIDEVIVSNVLQYSPEFLARNPHIRVEDALYLFGQSMYEMQTGGSISGMYDPSLRMSMFGKDHKISN